MNDDDIPHVPRPLPFQLMLAAASPTILLALLEGARGIGANVPVTRAQSVVLWLFTTLPLVLVLFGARALQPKGDPASKDVMTALEALGRAERATQAQIATLQRMEQMLAKNATPQPADPKPSLTRSPLLIILLVLGLSGSGLAYAFLAIPQPPEPVHIHATFAIFVEGERLAFIDPGFDLSARQVLASHLHMPDGEVLHIEGAPGATLGDVLQGALGITLSPGLLQLDDVAHGGRALPVDAARPFRVFVAPDQGDAWVEADARAGYVVEDLDRVLVTYGALHEDALAAQKDAVAKRRPSEIATPQATP